MRFYVDADILGLAHTLVRLRSDTTYPGDPGGVVHKRERPPCPITSASTPDTEWVPQVAKRGWLIITRDLNIAENYAERQTVRDSAAKMVALAGEDAGNPWAQLEVVMKQWRRIEQATLEPGPFIYIASRTVFRSLDLDAPAIRKSSGPRPRRRRGNPVEGLWREGEPPAG